MALTPGVLKRIEEWTRPPYGDDCIREIKALVDKNEEQELTERFGAELDFGTGGLRGIIRNGTNGMNIYVIAKATQGLANYVNKTCIEGGKAAIAYDSRKYSREFARETARVLASNGIKTYIFKEMRPTPELSFAVRYLGCVTGVVITASHNPKEYNGYKVYWQDGAQIITPHDERIIAEVRKIATLNEVCLNEFSDLEAKGMIEWIGEEIDQAFLAEIEKLHIHKDVLSGADLKIVYTPLHGTGGTLIPQALERLGLKKILFVKEQMQADSNFSTVQKPNPEEKEALSMGIELAKKEGADIVIATDPDADRMGIAVRNDHNEFYIVSGNHIGALLEYYILSERSKAGLLPNNSAVVKTIVTTQLQDDIARSFGLKVFNVLTGFKYIGQKIRNFEQDGNFEYIFGGEESYGYLPGTHARDKDAVAATLMIVELCVYIKTMGRSIGDYLEEIFQKYGYYDDITKSIDVPGLAGKKVIDSIMQHFREKPPTTVAGIAIMKHVDYKTDTVYDSEASPYELEKSNVIQYYLTDGSVITLRPSGTEPKIKFYFSAQGTSRQETAAKLQLLCDAIMPMVQTLITTKKKEFSE